MKRRQLSNAEWPAIDLFNIHHWITQYWRNLQTQIHPWNDFAQWKFLTTLFKCKIFPITLLSGHTQFTQKRSCHSWSHAPTTTRRTSTRDVTSKITKCSLVLVVLRPYWNASTIRICDIASIIAPTYLRNIRAKRQHVYNSLCCINWYSIHKETLRKQHKKALARAKDVGCSGYCALQTEGMDWRFLNWLSKAQND